MSHKMNNFLTFICFKDAFKQALKRCFKKERKNLREQYPDMEILSDLAEKYTGTQSGGRPSLKRKAESLQVLNRTKRNLVY